MLVKLYPFTVNFLVDSMAVIFSFSSIFQLSVNRSLELISDLNLFAIIESFEWYLTLVNPYRIYGFIKICKLRFANAIPAIMDGIKGAFNTNPSLKYIKSVLIKLQIYMIKKENSNSLIHFDNTLA
jgi:hypothetical protein